MEEIQQPSIEELHDFLKRNDLNPNRISKSLPGLSRSTASSWFKQNDKTRRKIPVYIWLILLEKFEKNRNVVDERKAKEYYYSMLESRYGGPYVGIKDIVINAYIAGARECSDGQA